MAKSTQREPDATAASRCVHRVVIVGQAERYRPLPNLSAGPALDVCSGSIMRTVSPASEGEFARVGL